MALKDIVPWSRSKAPGTYRGAEGNPVLALHREMNRVFDDFLRGDFFRGDLLRGFDDLAPGFGRSTGWPQTDLVETDKEYRVVAELPGLQEKDVEITLSDNVLTLKGEKTVESDGKERRQLGLRRALSRSVPALDPARRRYRSRQGVGLVQGRGSHHHRAEEPRGHDLGKAHQDQRPVTPVVAGRLAGIARRGAPPF